MVLHGNKLGFWFTIKIVNVEVTPVSCESSLKREIWMYQKLALLSLSIKHVAVSPISLHSHAPPLYECRAMT